jgi:hypothetical protein
LTEKQNFSEKSIVVWYLSSWEEIVGVLQDIFVTDSLLRILFSDGINIFVSLPDDNILQRLRSSRGKFITVCRTDASARRYLFDFKEKHTATNPSTMIHCKNDEEIAALKVLNGLNGNHGMRKKPWANLHRNQQQLYTWMGGQ